VSYEIERKFAVSELPSDFNHGNPTELRQGYIAVTEDGTEVRVRAEDDRRFELTVKAGAGLTRVEETVALDAAAFARLWPLTQGRRIEKQRVRCPLGEHTLEVDFYRGALEGLRVAEIEFPSAASAEAFAKPTWLGRELTQDGRFRNRALAELTDLTELET
jgi:CYTH domain-containing protein